MTKMRHSLFFLLGLLMLVSLAWAGGTAPGDEAPQQPAAQEKVSATPAQTSAAVRKARQSVVPAPKVTPSPKLPARTSANVQSEATTQADKNSWMLGSREGQCAPLASASRTTGDIGSFNTPQEFARKMQQRGHQAFVLDIGDVRDQVVRVKVPDIGVDLTFMKAAICR